VVETATRRRLALVTPARPIHAVALTSDGRSLAVGREGEVVLHDAETGHPRGRVPDLKGQVRALAYSPDGRWLAVGTSDGSLVLWDAEVGRKRYGLTGTKPRRLMRGERLDT
jgi:WD40 repeat protein